MDGHLVMSHGDFAVERASAACRWKNTSMENCKEGDFERLQECQAWIQEVASYVIAVLGREPNIETYTYTSGNSRLVAIDISNTDNSRYVAITVFLVAGCIQLAGTNGSQFDIALPGIDDACNLADSLRVATHG